MKKEYLFDVIISRDDEIIFKRAIFEKFNGKNLTFYLNNYGKRYFSFEWMMNSNNDKVIIPGRYSAMISSDDLGISLEVPFEIE